MKTYTVVLNESEQQGFDLITSDPQGWIDNVVKARCALAIDTNAKQVVDYCMKNDIAIPSSKEELISYGLENGIIMTAENFEAQSTPSMQEEPSESE